MAVITVRNQDVLIEKMQIPYRDVGHTKEAKKVYTIYVAPGRLNMQKYANENTKIA